VGRSPGDGRQHGQATRRSKTPQGVRDAADGEGYNERHSGVFNSRRGLLCAGVRAEFYSFSVPYPSIRLGDTPKKKKKKKKRKRNKYMDRACSYYVGGDGWPLTLHPK